MRVLCLPHPDLKGGEEVLMSEPTEPCGARRARPPVEPPATPWVFPPVEGADEAGLLGLGADLEPGTLVAAYRSGVFPMPIGPDETIGWWSPAPRAIIPLMGSMSRAR